MPNKLGEFVRKARLQAGLSLRELSRRIGKSPTYLVTLERSDDSPGATEATLEAIAEVLGKQPDLLLTLAQKTPAAVTPRNPTELAIYRLIGQLEPERQLELLAKLQKELTSGPESAKGD